MRDSSSDDSTRPEADDVARHNRIGRRRVLMGLGALGAIGASSEAIAACAPESADAAGGTGTNGTAITVAASDTPPEMRANANYVCSGTDDDVTINTAITALGNGGEVVLLPGTFHLGSGSNSYISLASANGGLKLSGSGYGSTITIPSGSSAPAAIVISSWNQGSQSLANFAILGSVGATGKTHGIWSQCNTPILENIWVHLAPGHGFLFDGGPSAKGGSPVNLTYQALVDSCIAQACGQGYAAGGDRGDGFHVTNLHQSALFTSCFVDGGSANDAGLVTTNLNSGTNYTSIPIAAPGAWAAIPSGKKLVVVYDAGASDGYALVTTTSSVAAGAASIPISGLTPGQTYYQGSTAILDPAVTTTGVGFFSNGSGCHFNDCHPYFCWVGHYTSEVSSYIQGGEYETCAHSNVIAVLPTVDAGCPFQVVGINSYGSPRIACISTYAGNDAVQIADCYLDGGQSMYGISSNEGHNHTVHDNVIRDALGSNYAQTGSAAISYQNGSNNNIHHNTILLSANAPSPLRAQHYGILISATTDSQVLDNNLTQVVATESTAIALENTNTGTIVRGNLGYNPGGSQTVGVPSSGSSVAAAAVDRTFYVQTGTGTTKIAISGGPTITLTAQALNTIRLPAGQTLTPTYSSAPTWVVEGE